MNLGLEALWGPARLLWETLDEHVTYSESGPLAVLTMELARASLQSGASVLSLACDLFSTVPLGEPRSNNKTDEPPVISQSDM